MSIRRLAGAIRTLLKRPRRTLQRVPLDELKQHALNTLVDCHDAGSDLLRGSIGRKAATRCTSGGCARRCTST